MIQFCLNRFRLARANSDSGFTLIEVLVSVMVGLTVLFIAVLTLVATNSASLRLLSKSEAQQNTRQAISLAFSEISDAESLVQCRVIKPEATNSDRKQIYLQDPTNPMAVAPGINDCKETSSSGRVLAFAAEYRVCYFKSQPRSGSANALENQPYIQCVTRGGEDVGTVTFSDPAAPAPCTGLSVAGVRQQLYTYTCGKASPSGDMLTPSFHNDANSTKLIADLGELPPSGPDSIVEAFTYIPAPTDPAQIIAIRIPLKAGYDSHLYDSAGETRKVYEFSQTIVLRGSEVYKEESSYDY